jgi:hypothetical protein
MLIYFSILSLSLFSRGIRTLIDPDGLAAGVAILGEHAVEAGEAVGSTLAHDVALTAQVLVAFETGKVFHVPGPPLSLSTLVREDYLKMLKIIGKLWR